MILLSHSYPQYPICSLFHYTKRVHIDFVRYKNSSAGVVRRSRNNSIPLTYERARKPHQIGVLKSWNSWNTANLKDEALYTPDITLQDRLIRMFIGGTFPTFVISEIIVKRQHNMVRVSFLLLHRLHFMEEYFLIGYAEEMLSIILRCVVKLEPRLVNQIEDITFRRV